MKLSKLALAVTISMTSSLVAAHGHNHEHEAKGNKLDLDKVDFSYEINLEGSYQSDKKFSSEASKGVSLGHTELSVEAKHEFTRGVITAALAEHSHGHSHGHDHSHDSKTEVELEEAFFEILPSVSDYGISAKLGRMKSAFGEYNKYHSHDFDFTDKPIVYRQIFGSEYVDDGASVSIALPAINTSLTYEALKGSDLVGKGHEDQASIGIQTLTSHSELSLTDHIKAEANFGMMLNRHGDNDWRDIIGNTKQSWHLGTAGRTYLAGGKLSFYNVAPIGIDNDLVLSAENFYQDDLTSDKFSGTTKKHNNGFHAAAIYQLDKKWKVGYRISQMNQTMNFSGEKNDFHKMVAREHDIMLSWVPLPRSELIAEYTRGETYLKNDPSPKFGNNIYKLTYRYSF